MLVDAPPIARAIRRTHTFLSRGGKRTLSRARRSRLTFPHASRSFGPPLQDVPPFVESRMEQSTKEAWRRLLDEARRELPDATVRTWLEPAEPIALDDGRLIVGAPDQFAVEWNESKHAGVLARAAERVFGRPTAVVFRVQEDRQQRPQMDFFVAPREAVALDKTGVLTTPLNERYTFQTFVIGKSNELAAAAAHAVAEAPGKTYNPLFIYGATGLGKTHLMQAVAHAVLTKYPGTRVHYFGAEQFINEVIESIHARTKAEQDQLELTLPDDVLRFIAEHIRSSVRELEGCIIKLLLFASLKNREVTIELAREALSDKIRQGEEAGGYGSQATPSIDRVQEVVSRRWGVTPEGLRSKARTKTLTIPRQVAMYLARGMLGMQLVEIGEAFGGRER